MKLMYMDWNSYGNEDMVYWFRKMGHQVIVCPFMTEAESKPEYAEYFIKYLASQATENAVDFLFSFNFYSVLSYAALAAGVKYVAWVYDNPASLVYHKAIQNECNRVFFFDHSMYREFVSLGIDNVYYLPLAANLNRLDQMIPTENCRKKYAADISFVGSTYCEKKQDFYSRLVGLPKSVLGYLDGAMEIQKNLYGKFILPEILIPEIVDEIQKVYPYESPEESMITPEYVYTNYFFARHVTAMERVEILNRLSDHHLVNIYTNGETPKLLKVHNRGKCEYYTQMPYIFKCSKINLNITLKSIQTGIPLRVFDVLGCGGFLISNYQEEMLEYFEPEKDFVYYECIDDLVDKCEFYLAHEELRKKISKHGHQAIAKAHTFQHRILEMMKYLNEQ